MSTNPLHEYEPTGLASINQIPTHWYARRLGQIGTFMKGSGGNKDDATDYGLPCIRYGDIYTSYKYHARHARSYISKDRAPDYARLKHGDALFAASGETVEDIGKSVVNLMTEEAYCGPDIILFRPEAEINPSYLGYVLDCPKIAYQKSCMGRGITIMHIYSSSLKYITIPLPPLEEQAAIVRFLDHANELVSHYISAKERLIALLEEQRQAVIHQAVTRGLTAEMELKPSGIPWLGEVPKHWTITALKRIGRFTSGSGFPVERQGENDLEIPFLKVSDMNLPSNQYFIQEWNNTVSQETAHNLGAKIFPAGTIIFPKVGGALLTNKRRITTVPSCIDNNVMACEVQQANPDFIFLRMQIIDLGDIAKPGPVPAISETDTREIKIGLPSLKEQSTIVEYASKQTHEISSAIHAQHQQVDLIQEYRTRLIADVVTGQLDVRDAPLELPGQHL